MSTTFSTHPRQIQRYRDVKPAVAGIPSFRCKCCGKVQFAFLGRKKAIGGGWKCAGCSTVSVPKTEIENGPVIAR